MAKDLSAHFSPEMPKFLRGLARHNERVWFDERKAVYESALKAPFLAVIAEIDEALPEAFRRPAHKSMMRIYRDIRFSKDKRPYKTHLAAWWAHAGMEKTTGAGFYLQIGAETMMVAAGVYMPAPEQLLAIRRHLLEHHGELRKLLGAKKLRAAFEPFDGLKLTRAPKGFPATDEEGKPHPALDLILHRQWGVAATLPVECALGPGLVAEVAGRFRLATPLVDFLNAPLAPAPAKPLF